jgi:hypothetical protein
VRGAALHVRDELDRRRTRADDRDPFPAQVVVVVPAGGVKRGAREGLEPRKAWHRWRRERSLGGDEHLAGELAAGGLHQPALPRAVPARFGDIGPEVGVAPQPEIVSAALQIGLDFGLTRKRPAPPGIRGEGERVEVARHVASAAGIGVVAPSAAHVVAALEQDEVGDARLLEADRHAEAGEPGADDGYPDLARRSSGGAARVGSRLAGRLGRRFAERGGHRLLPSSEELRR